MMNYRKAQRKLTNDYKGINHKNEKKIYGNNELLRSHVFVGCKKEIIPLSLSDCYDYSTVINYMPTDKSVEEVMSHEFVLTKIRNILDNRRSVVTALLLLASS